MLLKKRRGRGDGVRSPLAKVGFRRLLLRQRIIGAVDFVEDLLDLGAVEIRDLLRVRRPGLIIVRVLAEMRITVERDLREGLEDVGMRRGVVFPGDPRDKGWAAKFGDSAELISTLPFSLAFVSTGSQT